MATTIDNKSVDSQSGAHAKVLMGSIDSDRFNTILRKDKDFLENIKKKGASVLGKPFKEEKKKKKVRQNLFSKLAPSLPSDEKGRNVSAMMNAVSEAASRFEPSPAMGKRAGSTLNLMTSQKKDTSD